VNLYLNLVKLQEKNLESRSLRK